MRRLLPPILAVTAVCGCGIAPGELRHNIILPEQRTIEAFDPAQFPPARIPETGPPRTISDPQPETPDWPLSLDDAIRIALENGRVVRVFAGTSAASSGQTIYDTAIANAAIDQARARFDPILAQSNLWSGTNTPFAVPDPADPTRSLIAGQQTNAYLSNFGISQTNVFGGQLQATWLENPAWFPGGGGALNPQKPASVALSYTQPLLQGAGFRVNTAPIVIARLNTAQSFFQYKDSVQELVRGVIAAYWQLVQTRTEAWSRSIQVQQFKEIYDLQKARLDAGFGDEATFAQARVTFTQFKASQIAADAAVIRQEAALRNLLGLPPTDSRKIVPVSAPANQRLPRDWDALVKLAEQRRPDIVELKIVTEADLIRLMQSENQALPQLNAVGSYQWNGLSGTMPNGQPLAAAGGQFGNWTAGINFSVPLGLRQGRAQVRQQRLLIARDRANLDQGMHAAVHQLAGTVRELDSAYEQYLMYRQTREAAEANVRVQNEQFKANRIIYLNVLQALNDWGAAVTSESLQLLNYNTLLATLERQTGTILETHGLVFAEERVQAAGPLLLPKYDREYPAALFAGGAPQRYPATGGPSENAFDLKNPAVAPPKPAEPLPKPNPVGPGK